MPSSRRRRCRTPSTRRCATVVLRAMAKDPAERWPTAQAMAAAAQAATSPVPATVRVPGMDLVPVARPLPAVGAGRLWRRRPALVAAGVVAVLAGSGGAHRACAARRTQVGMLGALSTVGTSRPAPGPTRSGARAAIRAWAPPPGRAAPRPWAALGVGGDGGATGSSTGATPDETTGGTGTGGGPPTGVPVRTPLGFRGRARPERRRRGGGGQRAAQPGPAAGGPVTRRRKDRAAWVAQDPPGGIGGAPQHPR